MSVESRLVDLEEKVRLLRDADRLQGRRFSGAAPGLGAIPRWNTIDKVWDVEGLSDDLTTQFWFYTDFFRASGDDADPYFTQATSGTGAAFGNATAETSHFGTWTLTTGTTTTGHTNLNTRLDSLRFGEGRIRIGTWIRTPGNLSDATDRYLVYAGVFDNTTPGTATDGVFLRYRDNINSGKWEAALEDGGSGSVADTGITNVVDTWYYLEIEVNAASDRVEYFIDGASLATISAGPAADSTAEFRIGIVKSAGTTSRTMRIDAAYLVGDFTTAR